MPAANNFQDKKSAVKKSRHDTNTTDTAMNNDKKIHVSRIPTFFDEDAVKRLLEEKLGPNTVEEVVLIYKRPEQDDDNDKVVDNKTPKKHQGEEADAPTEHRGFGFVTFSSAQAHQQALDLESIRGGRTATSSKKHTLYLRPYVDTTSSDSTTAKNATSVQVCYLWAKHRCPYGKDCKFLHQGDGGCVEVTQNDNKDKTKKKQKCFAFKKGKCKRGDDCPFSHDFSVVEHQDDNNETTAKPTTKSSRNNKERPDSEKDCINWKTKGKCRKGDQCPYKHDPTVREAALSKQQQKQQQKQKVEQKQKRKRQEEQDVADNNHNNHKKSKQPLWVRVFGMNYDTTLEDIRAFLESCGPIVQVEFPTFADSGRSKGYCGVLFQSPKAVAKALELDGQELQGRWLRIQAGKMLLEQWEDREQQQHQQQQQQSLKQE